MSSEGTEFWTGDLTSSNIGPAKGDHFLGKVNGPGVYRLVGLTGGGKTSHLDLLTKAQSEGSLKSIANITEGELSAHIQLGALRITFSKGLGGEIKDPERQGHGEIPPIENIPDATLTLITADNLIGDEARMRRRLKALLSHLPVDSSATAQDHVMRTLDGKWFSLVENDDFVSLWWDLANAAKGETSKRITGFLNAEGIRELIRGEQRPSILDDHSEMVRILNLLATTAEHCSGVQSGIVAGIKGELEGALKSACESLRYKGEESKLAAELRTEYSIPALSQREAEAADIYRQRSFEHQSFLTSSRRIEVMRESHSSNPPDDAFQWELVSQQSQEVDSLESARNSIAREISSLNCSLGKTHVPPEVTRNVFEKLSKEISQAAESTFGQDMALGESFAPASVDQFCKTVSGMCADLRKVNSDAYAAFSSARAINLEIESLDGKLDETDKSLSLARDKLAEAQKELRNINLQRSSWEEVEAELSKELKGTQEKDVEEALQEWEKYKREMAKARLAKSFRDIEARLARAEEMHVNLAEARRGFVDAKKESWRFLGEAINESLSVPWICLDGTDLYIVFDSRNRKLAGSMTPKENLEPRSIDDGVAISEGELRDAILRLMIERRDKSQGIIRVPREILQALDDDRLIAFHEFCVAHSAVVISERPWVISDGEQRTMFLESVADLKSQRDEADEVQ